jgi:hypothetical protein
MTTIKHEPLVGASSGSPTIAEGSEQARYCEWYAAKPSGESDRRYPLERRGTGGG